MALLLTASTATLAVFAALLKAKKVCDGSKHDSQAAGVGPIVFEGGATTHSTLEDRTEMLERELAHSRQQVAHLQQLQGDKLAGVQQKLQHATSLLSTISCRCDKLIANDQHQTARIQQLLRENAALRDTILSQAEQASQHQQQLHDQVQQEQAHSFSLSCQLQQATASQHQLQLSLSLLQSEQEGMVAAAKSMCEASKGGEARIAQLQATVDALQCEVASLVGERDALTAMCSALTAHLSRAIARAACRTAGGADGANGARAVATSEGQGQTEQPEQQVLQPCSPSRSHELPLISQSVWCSSSSSGSASLSASSCCSCSGEDDLGEVDSVGMGQL